MNPPLQAAFDAFRHTLISCQLALADIFEFTAEYLANDQPQIAYALNSHMRDYLSEMAAAGAEPVDFGVDFGAILAEGYRRTFCDPALSEVYGTGHLTKDETKVIGMLGAVAEGLQAFHDSPNPQQVLDLAEAVNTGAAH